MRYIIIYTIAILLSTVKYSNSLYAQDLKKDIASMNKAYSVSNLDVTLYADSYKSEKKIRLFKSRVKKSESGYWFKMNWVTYLQNKDYEIVISEEDKSIAWNKTPKSALNWRKKKLVPAELETALDSVKWEYKGIVNGSKHYSIDLKNNSYESMELYLDSKMHFIRKLIYHYKGNSTMDKPDRMEIVYEKTNLTPIFSDEEFSHLKYLSKKKGKWSPTFKYSGYTIVQNK